MGASKNTDYQDYIRQGCYVTQFARYFSNTGLPNYVVPGGAWLKSLLGQQVSRLSLNAGRDNSIHAQVFCGFPQSLMLCQQLTHYRQTSKHTADLIFLCSETSFALFLLSILLSCIFHLSYVICSNNNGGDYDVISVRSVHQRCHFSEREMTFYDLSHKTQPLYFMCVSILNRPSGY